MTAADAAAEIVEGAYEHPAHRISSIALSPRRSAPQPTPSYLAQQLQCFWDDAIYAHDIPLLSPAYLLAQQRDRHAYRQVRARLQPGGAPIPGVHLFGQHTEIHGGLLPPFVPAIERSGGASGISTNGATNGTTTATSSHTDRAIANNFVYRHYYPLSGELTGYLDHCAQENDRHIDFRLLQVHYTCDLPALSSCATETSGVAVAVTDLAQLLRDTSYDVLVHLTRVQRRLARWYRAIKQTRLALQSYDVVPKSYYARAPYGVSCTVAQRKKLSLVSTQQQIALYRSVFYIFAYDRLYVSERGMQSRSRKHVERFCVQEILLPVIHAVVERACAMQNATFLLSQPHYQQLLQQHQQQQLSFSSASGESTASSAYFSANGAASSTTNSNGEDLTKMMKDLSKKSKKKFSSLLKTFTQSTGLSSTPVRATAGVGHGNAGSASGKWSPVNPQSTVATHPSSSSSSSSITTGSSFSTNAPATQEEETADLVDELLSRASSIHLRLDQERGAEDEEEDDEGNDDNGGGEYAGAEQGAAGRGLRPSSVPSSSTSTSTSASALSRPLSVHEGSFPHGASSSSTDAQHTNRGGVSPVRSWTRYLTG